MAIANVSVTTSTFFEWLTKTNQLIVIGNRLTEGQANSTGTLTLTNSGGVNGGVTLNVSSGLIKGDGGLITNVSTSVLTTNTISVVSNSATLTVAGGTNAELGGVIYLNIGTLSVDTGDQSVANIASANTVNTAHSLAISAFNAANNAVTDYSPAFDAANTAQSDATAAWTAANNAVTDFSPAFDKANTANIAATAAFNQANTTAAYANSSGITFPNGNTITNFTVSTSAPTGGANGDIWIQVTA